jgi:hypothetical protein
MTTQLEVSPRDEIERLLGAPGRNPLKDLFREEADAQQPQPRAAESRYQHYVVETQPGGQQEVHKLREYAEADRARFAASPTFRFRWRCERLLEQAEQALALDGESMEFEHRATLLWAEVAGLSEYLGGAPEVDELIAALHVAYAQHVKRLTPKPVVEALAAVFRLVSQYTRLPTKAVDEALDALEQAGVDLNYPMAFAKSDA